MSSPLLQSFCAALHQELKEYYRLLSVLHSQVGLHVWYMVRDHMAVATRPWVAGPVAQGGVLQTFSPAVTWAETG